MICHVFKRRRRANGELLESREWFGALRLDWESRTRRWCLGTPDCREAERLLHAERVKAEKRHHGLIPPEEHAVAQGRSLNELLEAFLADLRLLGRAEGTLRKYRYMHVLFEHCRWKKIGDVTARSFCDWRAHSTLAPRTLNALLKDTGTFFRWLRRQRMVSENPLEFVPCMDTRRLEKFRRALTEGEVRRLIAAAPYDRAVIYLLAVYTGLRRAEIGQLTIGDFVFDSPAPFVRVRASTAKNPKESQLRLRPEVVEAIRSVLPDSASATERMFSSVPRVRTFKKDLERAGIAFADGDARRVDFHALRDTFGTHLAASGVAPFVLKELMRHSTVQQSEKYYIDARHLPLAAAVASLPAFSLPLMAVL
mgnify:CR=1 FL=1